MGLDVLGLNVCGVVQKRRSGLGSVITIGRQGVHLSTEEADQRLPDLKGPLPPFCEPLLMSNFGATECLSIDGSGYENATYVQDLNTDLDEAIRRDFDVALDLGTLEHVYDVKSSFTNVDALVGIGGTVAHALPANQQCGHGFFQFSPEFFFSHYGPDSGFAHLELYAVQEEYPDDWYRISQPRPGERAMLFSSRSLYLVCIVDKVGDRLSGHAVQQSDYVQLWSEALQEDASYPPTRLALRNRVPFGVWFANTSTYRSTRQRARQSREKLHALSLALGSKPHSNVPLEYFNIREALKSCP